MKKVLVETASGRLCDIVLPGAEFPVAPGLQWVDAPDDVSHATHEYSGGAVVAKPPKPLNEVQAAKLAELERARIAAETAPVTVGGKTYNPSESVTNLLANLGARLRRGKPTTLSALYEANGNPVSPVTQAIVESIEDAIAAQREAAWNRYGTRIAAVAAATTAEQVQAIAW